MSKHETRNKNKNKIPNRLHIFAFLIRDYDLINYGNDIDICSDQKIKLQRYIIVFYATWENDDG